MASLRDIRKRIRSIKNTQKITKAMKMVAAAKLRRAQERVMATRPYSNKLAQTIAAIAQRAATLGEAPHPLLQQRPKGGNTEVIALTSDRGLCGAFNSSVIRRSLRFHFDEKANYQSMRFSTIGRKGFDAFKRERLNLHRNHEDVISNITFDKAIKIAEELCKAFLDGEIDSTHIIYNEFVSAISQNLKVLQLLPINPAVLETTTVENSVDYEYEPNRTALLDALLPRYFATCIYRALLESYASELGARMTAMDNATKSAKEIVEGLTLTYNRARQAAITKELMEIISGAEALR